MLFKRPVTAILCSVLMSCILVGSADAGGKYREYKVQSGENKEVSVRVQKSMLRGCTVTVDGVNYTEEEWVRFFVRNLLVGETVSEIDRVELCKSAPDCSCRGFLVCPPIFRRGEGFWAAVSHSSLRIWCSNLLSTMYCKWLLNESGLSLFGNIRDLH